VQTVEAADRWAGLELLVVQVLQQVDPELLERRHDALPRIVAALVGRLDQPVGPEVPATRPAQPQPPEGADQVTPGAAKTRFALVFNPPRRISSITIRAEINAPVDELRLVAKEATDRERALDALDGVPTSPTTNGSRRASPNREGGREVAPASSTRRCADGRPRVRAGQPRLHRRRSR
jgi:hypothetical protein